MQIFEAELSHFRKLLLENGQLHISIAPLGTLSFGLMLPF
jgi:hypothetical protein